MTKPMTQVSCPQDIDDYLRPILQNALQEEFHVLLLTTHNRVKERLMVYRGTVNSINVRAAEILRPAVIAGTPAIILAHNHPSGNPEPSGPDLDTTKRVSEAASLFDIQVLDHLVLGQEGHYSVRAKRPELLRSSKQPPQAAERCAKLYRA